MMFRRGPQKTHIRPKAGGGAAVETLVEMYNSPRGTWGSRRAHIIIF